MALSKINTPALVADAVDNTILDLADNFAFTGTVSGVGGLTPLSTVTVSSATANITFDNLSTDYDTYMFFIEVHPYNDNVSLYSRFLDSSGSELAGGNGYGWYADQDGTTLNSNLESYMRLSNSMGGNSYEGYRGVATLQGRNYVVNTSVKPPQISGTYSIMNSSSVLSGGAFYAAQSYQGAAVIRGIRFYFNSGNIEKGKISIYGVKQP